MAILVIHPHGPAEGTPFNSPPDSASTSIFVGVVPLGSGIAGTVRFRPWSARSLYSSSHDNLRS